jgi:hypothetical protein
MSNKPKRPRKQASRKKPTKSSELASAPESALPPEPLQTPEPASTEPTETPELAPVSEVPTAEPSEPTATQEPTPILDPEPDQSPKREEQPTRKVKKGGFGSFFKYIGKRPPKYVPKQRLPEEPAPELSQTSEPAQEPIPEQVIVTKPTPTTAEPTLTPTKLPESTLAMEPVPVSAVASEPVLARQPASIAKPFPTPEPMPERLPGPKQEPRKQSKEKARKPKLVKAYMRNLGKGKLKFQDESIKFYTEKGTFKKERQLAKQIDLAKIDSATIDKKKNELIIKFQDETETFIIKDKLYVKILLGKIDQAIFMREPLPPPTPEHTITSSAIDLAFGVEKPVPKDYKKTLTTALSVVDSLFDILMCLQGRVDWASIGKNAETCEKDYSKVADKTTMETANLDLSLLVSAATEHNVELTSEEASRLLESLYTSFNGAESKFPLSSKAVTPYYVLNDVFLGVVVGDPVVEDELNELRAMLADLAKSTGMNVGEVAEAASRLVEERLKEPYIEQARNFFRQQLFATVPK